MKKILTSLIALLFSMPVFATITNNATCDSTNLGQSENNSTANVEADWTANTININWYIDDTAQITMATNTCTYDGTITLPPEPTKTGYTFAGWQLRANAGASQAPAQQTVCPNISIAQCNDTPGCRTCRYGPNCNENNCYYSVDSCEIYTTESDCNNSNAVNQGTACYLDTNAGGCSNIR